MVDVGGACEEGRASAEAQTLRSGPDALHTIEYFSGSNAGKRGAHHCLSARACVRVCVCVCVCKCERERERERESVCVCVCV